MSARRGPFPQMKTELGATDAAISCWSRQSSYSVRAIQSLSVRHAIAAAALPKPFAGFCVQDRRRVMTSLHRLTSHTRRRRPHNSPMKQLSKRQVVIGVLWSHWSLCFAFAAFFLTHYVNSWSISIATSLSGANNARWKQGQSILNHRRLSRWISYDAGPFTLYTFYQVLPRPRRNDISMSISSSMNSGRPISIAESSISLFSLFENEWLPLPSDAFQLGVVQAGFPFRDSSALWLFDSRQGTILWRGALSMHHNAAQFNPWSPTVIIYNVGWWSIINFFCFYFGITACIVIYHSAARLAVLFGRRSLSCAGCGYDRTGLPPELPCPECGRPTSVSTR